MCQYTSRCRVTQHRPGTICPYRAGQRLSASVLAVGALFVGMKALDVDLPKLSSLTTRAAETQTATVTRVIDGDTITARADDGTDLGRVRILGIDAPEIDTNDCGADAARTATRDLLQDEEVHLIADPKNDDRDTYGRLLRYVEITPNTDAGLQLIRAGDVRTFTEPNTHSRHDTYAHSGGRARAAHRGLWGHC